MNVFTSSISLFATTLFFLIGAMPIRSEARQADFLLIMLHDGDKSEPKFAFEQLLRDELTLTLGDVATVDQKDLGGRGAGASLSERLLLARQVAAEVGAQAVLWTTFDNEKMVAVHLVTLKKELTLLRTVWVPVGPGAAGGVALAVREMIYFSAKGHGAAVNEAPGRSNDRMPHLIVVGPTGSEQTTDTKFAEAFRRHLRGRVAIDDEPEGSAFRASPLAKQLALLAALAKRRGAVAVIWIKRTLEGMLAVHLLVSGDGRSSVRSLQFEPAPSVEYEIAVAVSQLLEDLYPFGVQPPATTLAPSVEERSSLFASVQAVAGGGAYGHHGRSLMLGGNLGFALEIPQGFFAKLALTVLAGPFDRRAGRDILGREVEPLFGLGYLWHLQRFAFGLSAAIATPYSKVNVTLGNGERRSFSWWSPRWSAAMDLHFKLSSRIGLVASGALGGVPDNQIFERTSDGQNVLATPFVSWRTSLGLTILINK